MKKIRTPVATLVAMVALGLVLLLVNQTRGPNVDTAAAPPADPAPAATAPPAPAPSAPPAAAAEQETAYFGYTTGRRMSVAVVVQGDRAVAYLCDGSSVEAWLQGSAAGDRVQLSGADGARLTGTRGGGKITGKVWVNNRSYAFSAAVAGPPAGLYESRTDTDGRTDRIGWIVQPDGTQVGIRTVDGRSEPASTLDERRLSTKVAGSDRDAQPVTPGRSR